MPVARTLLLILIIAVGVAVRLPGLLSRSMWFDEAVVWAEVTQFSWPEMVRRAGLAVHPPGFFALMRLWMEVVGDSLTSLRLFSIGWAALGIPATYLFCRDAFAERVAEASLVSSRSRGIGLTAAAFLALASYHIVWSQQARMYGMGVTLAVFSSWLLVRALRQEASRWWWAGYTLSAVAATYTHNFLLFTVGAQGIVAFGVMVERSVRHNRVLLTKDAFVTLCTVYGTVAVLYFPWLSSLLAQSERVRADYWIPPWSFRRLLNVWYDLFVPEARRYGLWGPGFVAGTTAAVLACCAAQRRIGNVFTTAMAAIPILSAVAVSVLSAPIVVSRYFLFAQVFVFIAGAEIAWRIAKPIRIVVVAAILCNLTLIHAQHWRKLDVAERPGLAVAMQHVLDHRRPDEPVVSIHPSIFHAVQYYSRGKVAPRLLLEIPMEQVPHYKGGPLLIQEDVISQDDLDAMPLDAVWVVSTTGFPIGFERITLRPPWEYDRGSGRVYQEVFDFQGEIIVARYVRAAQRDGNRVASTHVAR